MCIIHMYVAMYMKINVGKTLKEEFELHVRNVSK